MTLSVVIITYNEEVNIGRTLESVKPLVADAKGEIIVVDSGSADRTVEIAKSYGAKVFIEHWKGYAAQKNSALDKATGDWILSLDADEQVDSGLRDEIESHLDAEDQLQSRQFCATLHEANEGASRLEVLKGAPIGFWIPRRNLFLGRWIKHGGFWPDPKLRLFQRGAATFEDRLVHEDARVNGPTGRLTGTLIHHSYPALSDYLDHMNRYSSLGAEMAAAKLPRGFSLINIVLRPLATFVYNYFFRLGFLDGHEGLLLHLYHSAYVSWKYAKAWELSRKADSSSLRSS